MPPHNSIRGWHHYTTGLTCALAHTLLTILVLYIQALRPTINVYMLGRLVIIDSTAATSTASQMQRSGATFKIIPSHQLTRNPLILATISNAELIAGAHSFFGYGAPQVAPLPIFFPDNEPTCYENDYCSETACKPAIADYN